MPRQLPMRQRVRTALLTLSFVLFPLTLYYFSPYLIIEGAAQGIIVGSFLVFGLMFFAALFLGRLWCGWACPAGGLEEFLIPANSRPVRSKWADRVKWLIWTPWVLVIAAVTLSAGGLHQVNPFFLTSNGISVAEPTAYIVYYAVVGLFIVLSLTVGRRAGCHTVCWMAPFMILGRKVRNAVGLPGLELVGDGKRCVDCLKCTTHCPMSLDVHTLVKSGSMEHPECILCGTCVDNCSKGAIHYTFRTPA